MTYVGTSNKLILTTHKPNIVKYTGAFAPVFSTSWRSYGKSASDEKVHPITFETQYTTT